MKGKILWTLGAAVAYSVASYAGTMGAAEQSNYPAGFVIGGDVGYGYLSTQETDLVLPVSQLPTTRQQQNHDIGNIIGGGHIGYDYLLWDRVVAGFEVGYKYLGNSTFNATFPSLSLLSPSPVETINAKVTQQAIDLLVTSRLYVWKGLSIEAKAGGAFVNSAAKNRWTITNPSTGAYSDVWEVNPSVWRLEPEVGIGGGWLLGRGVSLLGMYTHIFGNSFAANPSMNGAYANTAYTPGY